MELSEIRNDRVNRIPAENVVFEKQYDVIVCGVGTAGSVAVLLTAQNGLSVLGIETNSCLGGTATIGGVQGHYFDTPGGRYLEIDRMVDEYRDAHCRTKLDSRVLVCEDLILQNGGELLYESSVCGVYLVDNRVVGIKAITPDGLKNFGCRVLMDCTGDAYCAHMAGCETEFGRNLDGLTQPYSMVSCVLNDNGQDVRTTNIDFGRVDQRNDRQLSEALIFSRGYEMREERGNQNFLFHMPLLGVREGSRIVPEETVKVEAVFNGITTCEPAFYAYADLDKHGWDIAFDGESLGDWAIGANLGAYNLTIPVPWKAIIPRNMDGILVPCRGLGVDRDTSSCVRMLPDMKKVAEVGADLAMLAIRNGCPLREVPYEQLRSRLEASGCLDRTYACDCRVDGSRNFDGSPLVRRDVHFATEPEQLEEKLATLTPGEAIWAAKKMGSRCWDTLRKLLDSQQEHTAKHAAFALAITGNGEGIPLLRKMVAERDGVMLQDCRKHNQQRGCMAIYFLGRLGDPEIVDTLSQILLDEEELNKPAYHQNLTVGTRYRVEDFQDAYFQFATNAVMALIRIGDAHPEVRGKIKSVFRKAFEGDAYYDRITSRPKQSSEGSMVLNMKAVAVHAMDRWN